MEMNNEKQKDIAYDGMCRHPNYPKGPITLNEKIAMINSWGNGRNEDIHWIDARIIDILRKAISQELSGKEARR